MDKQLIRSFLEAFAAGDAIGKATEYCSMEEIAANYSSIDRILPPKESLSHSELPFGSVTDDTEQVVCLLDEYTKKGMVDAHDTAMRLLSWVEESQVAKTTMGPSSIAALNAIKAGEDINVTGIYGTTCGGIMRSPSAFFMSSEKNLEENTVKCLLPTHNTKCAMEAALSYNYALLAASQDKDFDSILDYAEMGCDIGGKHGNHIRTCGVGPSVKARVRYLRKLIPQLDSEKEFKDFISSVIGTTLASPDVAAAVFAIFMYTHGDVMKSIRIASEIGGDTDTIACLAAGLGTMYSKKHDIPREYIDIIEKANNLDFGILSEKISIFRENNIKETF